MFNLLHLHSGQLKAVGQLYNKAQVAKVGLEKRGAFALPPSLFVTRIQQNCY